MARIYIARTTGIGSFERHVVLKLITPERANDATAVTMFLDEARLAASLNHQNVAQVFEVGEDAGIHYLAMEYVHGQDLRALLAKAGSQGTRVPLDLALTVVAGAAAGLNHAHERRGADGVPLGIVHRDVSPSNIMIGLDGSVKLLDFGIAKAAARSIETQSGIIKGKFAYMSPEQCRGREVDRRSDVFSLGIILYEISTQHRCFRADSDFDTMHRIVTGDVLRPTRLVQGYPQALEAIVLKALAVDANQRYQSAGALLEAVESFSVSARMSLSTMALGRFMRDMFGETAEPWLTTARLSQPVQPKESTISNTNSSEPIAPQRNSGLTPPAEPARTLLDMQRGADETDRVPADAEEWNAKSYPMMQPSYAQPDAIRQSSPQLPTVAPQQHPHVPNSIPTPPSGVAPQVGPMSQQFSAVPGSGSAPAHPAHATHPAHPAHPALPGMPIVSTRHGYASAPGMSRDNLSYPRYERPADEDDEVKLKPNRRPLFIGLGIVLVGLAVLLVISLTKNDVVKPVDTSVSDEPLGGSGSGNAIGSDGSDGSADKAVAEVQNVAPGSGSEDADESIAIHVVSDPAGADVLLAGKPIGTTPLDIKYPRDARQVMLVVHKASYVDVETRIDLSGDFSKEVTLLKTEPKEPKEPEHGKGSGTKTDPDPAGTGKATGTSGKPTGTSGKTTGTAGTGTSGKTTGTSGTGKTTGKTTSGTGSGKTTTGTSGTGTSGKPTGTGSGKTTGTGKTTPSSAGSGATKPKDPKPNCQPADKVQPWDTRPVCK